MVRSREYRNILSKLEENILEKRDIDDGQLVPLVVYKMFSLDAFSETARRCVDVLVYIYSKALTTFGFSKHYFTVTEEDKPVR